MTVKNNKFKGNKWEDFLAKEKRDPEFKLAHRLEFDTLQLAKKVKALREKRDLTQEQLAHLIGTKQPAIARLESGNISPRLDMLERIAHVLGTHLDVKFVANRV